MPCLKLPEAGNRNPHNTESPASIQLPRPARSGVVSLEEALSQRRSAQGITGSDGIRTAPSAGALCPLEIYVVLLSGFYHYDPSHHRLDRLSPDDLRLALYRAAVEQQAIREAEVVFVMTAVFERTSQKYGVARGRRYVQLEAGHAAENLLLQAVALGLGAVSMGAFHDAEVQKALSLPRNHQPLYLIPAGTPRQFFVMGICRLTSLSPYK
jgi:SagB-type dehydrogenase family enzyme